MSSLSDQIVQLRSMLDTCESEVKSLNAGKKAAASRARKSLQNIKAQSHGLRKDITKYTSGLEVKKRSSFINVLFI